MKKLLAGLITTAVVVTSVVGLTACNKPGGGQSLINHASSSQDLLGMAMASAGSYVPQEGSKASVTAELTEAEANVIVDEIESRIQMITDFVKTENKPSTVIENFTPAEDQTELQGFDKKMVFNKKDIYGNAETYTFYYKEVKENGDDVPEEDEADLETEEEFKLTGKLAIDDKLYDMVGERSVETETEEEDGVTSTETESEFKAEVTFEDGSKMVFKQEIEVEGNEREESFNYTIEDKEGHVIDQFSIEIENEQGENEIEYYDSRNDIRIELEEELKKNSNELELKYNHGKVLKTAKVIITVDGNVETRTYKVDKQTIVRTTELPAPEANQEATEQI